MARQAYLLVDSSHPLFPAAEARRIEDRAKLVINAIESHHSISLPPVRFVLKQQALGGRSSQETAETLFGGGNHSSVRILFTVAQLSSKLLTQAFATSKLLALILEVEHPPHNVVTGRIGPARARFHVSQDRSQRMIEDIMIDVTLGNFFCQTGNVKMAIDRLGHPGLFKLKAQFARERIGSSWLNEVNKRAQYATLASFGHADDNDTTQRAKAAFGSWVEFSEWLADKVRAPSERTRRTAVALTRIPRIGGQLPRRRIESKLAELPDGHYALFILRTASKARKSLSLKRKIASIFGKSARFNSIRFVPILTYRSRYRLLSNLIRSGHIVHYDVTVSEDAILLAKGEL